MLAILTTHMETRLNWLTQIFVDCNRFDKGEINEVGIEREYINKRHTDETKTKLTETFLITPAGIHTNKTKLQNKVQ